ncbi:MAG TPA: hypothetical protein VK116_01700, partial [Planctomycetota bacterium]|nr:hypothetical protein [Planctomycetota bacterium]
MRVALVVGIVFGALRLGATAMAHPPADDLEPITGVDAQPLIAQARRIADALDFVGSPLEPAEKSALEAAFELPAEEAVAAIQRVFAPRVLIDVHINPESRVKVARGPAPPRLIQLGWRTFLVRVHNEPGVTAPLRVESPNARPLHHRSTGSKAPEVSIPPSEVANRWADVAMFDGRPLSPTLSGLALEYRIIEIYSRDVGKRE